MTRLHEPRQSTVTIRLTRPPSLVSAEADQTNAYKLTARALSICSPPITWTQPRRLHLSCPEQLLDTIQQTHRSNYSMLSKISTNPVGCILFRPLQVESFTMPDSFSELQWHDILGASSRRGFAAHKALENPQSHLAVNLPHAVFEMAKCGWCLLKR